MRVRSWGGLVVVTALALLLPASVAASDTLEADNPANSCGTPLVQTSVSGEFGSTVVVEDSVEIDLVTLDTDPGGEVVDVEWADDGHEATITATDQVNTYVVWSCAPINGEPVQRNEDQDV
jgi:hypothetical protein